MFSLKNIPFVGNCFTHTKIGTNMYVLRILKHQIKLQSQVSVFRSVCFNLLFTKWSLCAAFVHARVSLNTAGITCSIYTNKTEFQHFFSTFEIGCKFGFSQTTRPAPIKCLKSTPKLSQYS